MKSTRLRLLERTPKVLLSHGLAHSSVRLLTNEADANVAAINYHFGSREGLIREVIRSAARELADAWLRGVDEGEVPEVDLEVPRTAGLLRAYSQALGADPRRTALVAMGLTSHNTSLMNLITAELAEGLRRVVGAVHLARPEMDRQEIYSVLTMALGAALLWLPNPGLTERLAEGRYRTEGSSGFTRRLFELLEAAMS